MMFARVRWVTLLLLVVAGAANAQTSQWSLGPDMNYPRSPLTVLLPDGRVLAAGGSSAAPSTAEVFDPATNKWSMTGNMVTEGGSVTLLGNGLVLVAGGVAYGTPIATAQLYNPKTGIWTATGSMATPRSNHRATLLGNGMVLVTGGCCLSPFPQTSLTSAELYNPVTGTWTPAGNMAAGRYSHSATLLNDGTVLVAGGVYYQNKGVLASAEIYTPAAGTWQTTSSMVTARGIHGSAKLADGTVLVMGGTPGGCCSGLATAEVYNLTTKTWNSVGTMSTGRTGVTATVLTDGTVLAVGGYSCCLSPDSYTASTETYNPQTKQWTSAGNLSSPRAYGLGAVRLNDGRVLIAGGSNTGHPAVATTDIFAGTNSLPPQLIAGNDSLSTKQGTPLTFSGTQLLANDSDPDGDKVSIAGMDAVSKSGGTIVNNGNGTYTYTPPSGFAGTDTFSYSITDGNGSTASAIVTVSVSAAPPPGSAATYFPTGVVITVGRYDGGTMASLVVEDNNTYDVRSANAAGNNVTDWYGTTNMPISSPPATVTQLTVTYMGQYSRSSVTQQLFLYNFNTASWDLFNTQTVGNSDDATASANVATNPPRYISPSTGEMRARIRGSSLSSRSFYCWANFLSFKVQ